MQPAPEYEPVRGPYETWVETDNGSTKKPVLTLWDMAGAYESSRLEVLKYYGVDVILLLFAIDSPESLENIEDQVSPVIFGLQSNACSGARRYI